VVLPRRGYAPLLGRLLHDRTADKIAAVVSQVPDSAATIIPFDVESRVHLLHARQAARLAATPVSPTTPAARRNPRRLNWLDPLSSADSTDASLVRDDWARSTGRGSPTP
jgi:hypothetical protein